MFQKKLYSISSMNVEMVNKKLNFRSNVKLIINIKGISDYTKEDLNSVVMSIIWLAFTLPICRLPEI